MNSQRFFEPDEAKRSVEIYRELKDFHGSGLMIGCGHEKQHHFSFLSKPVHSSALHSSDEFYHVSLANSYSAEGLPDLEGDFLDETVIDYLSEKKFDLICFESVTEIFSSEDSRKQALENAKKLLSKNGICFIYFGGRSEEGLEETIKQFQYSYSFCYGINNAWSIIASDHPFDLAEVMRTNPYLNYMGNHVIRHKTNLSISLNYKEQALEVHLKSSDRNHIDLLKEINPFAREKLISMNKLFHEALEHDDKDSDEDETSKLKFNKKAE